MKSLSNYRSPENKLISYATWDEADYRYHRGNSSLAKFVQVGYKKMDVQNIAPNTTIKLFPSIFEFSCLVQVQ